MSSRGSAALARKPAAPPDSAVSIGVVAEGGQDDHLRPGREFGDAPRRRQAVQMRHLDVQQRDVWSVLERTAERLLTLSGLGHHLDLWVAGEDAADAGAYQRLVVGEQHPDPAARRCRPIVVLCGHECLGSRGSLDTSTPSRKHSRYMS